MINAPREVPPWWEQSLWIYPSPVSYTHLDVYKRQIVRLPVNKVGLVSKINKTFSELEQKYQREATPEEVSIYLGLSIDEVLGALDLAGRHVSMDAPFQEGESNSLIDVLRCV